VEWTPWFILNLDSEIGSGVVESRFTSTSTVGTSQCLWQCEALGAPAHPSKPLVVYRAGFSFPTFL